MPENVRVLSTRQLNWYRSCSSIEPLDLSQGGKEEGDVNDAETPGRYDKKKGAAALLRIWGQCPSVYHVTRVRDDSNGNQARKKEGGTLLYSTAIVF